MNQFIKTRNHNTLWKAVYLLLMFSVLMGCNQSTPSTPIFFPQIRSTTYMEADTTGQLVLEENCLRLKHVEGDTSYLLIWPPDFSVKEKNDRLQVFDGTGQIVAAVDDEVTLAGGEVPERFKGEMEQQIGQAFPEACPGPYWIVAPP